MVEIITQSQAREIKRLPFCYMCGDRIDNRVLRNQDHVPPECMFLKKDRDFPIIMKVHVPCNVSWSVDDEKVGLLIRLLHGEDIRKHKGKYKVQIAVGKDKKPLYPLLGGIPLKPMIFRIVRAFHAALYHEFLPRDTKNAILTPIPEAEFINGHVTVRKVLPQFRDFSKELRRNMLTRTTDRIIACNAKVRYECCWTNSDDGKHDLCIFGLRIYEWGKLGNKVSSEEYTCIGAYMPTSIPKLATKGSSLHVSFPKGLSLDPFAG
jgi:hypothetical protein